MANRPFAQINCSLMDSAKFTALKTPEARWAYMACHLAEQCNFIGMFKYPRYIWAHNSFVRTEEMDDLIADLVRVGLVEYNHDHEIIRIVDWFHKKNGPENKSQAVKAISDLQSFDISSDRMLVRSIAEFSVATTNRGRNWPVEWAITRGKIGELLRQTFRDNGSYVLDAIIEEVEKTSRSVIDELDSMLPAIKQHRVDTLSAGCQDTRQDETKPRQNRNKTKTCAVESENQSNVSDSEEIDNLRRRENAASAAMPRKETLNSTLVKGS